MRTSGPLRLPGVRFLFVLLLLLVLACDGSTGVESLDPAVFEATALTALSSLQYGRIYLLKIPTYDGSGQVVHPDYAATSGGPFRYSDHLAITPYRFSKVELENPSVFASSSPLTWVLENGAPNPVVKPNAGYLSDPDLVYVAERRELWLYYRQVTQSNLIHLVRSTDGVHWTSPVLVASTPNHKLISPAIVRRGPKDWRMWSVNGGLYGCHGGSTSVEVRHSEDGQHWSSPSPVNLRQPGFYAWHIDVQWIPARNEFWAVYNVKVPKNCDTPAVYLATSRDGVTWSTRSQPLLAKGSIPAFADIVYRTTFSYDPVSDDIVFWYSGARYNGQAWVWSAAVQRRKRRDTFQSSLAAYDNRALLVPAPARLEVWP